MKGLKLISLLVVLVLSFSGTWTSNNYLYKPSQGEYGTTGKQNFDTGLDRVDAKLARYVGVGDPGYTTFSEAIATLNLSSTPSTLHVPSGTHTVSSNLTCNSNINISPVAGAVFSIATGTTLTINGSLDAGPYRIFSYTGTGKVVFAATSPQTRMYPEWWGAVGDAIVTTAGALTSGTDDYLAFDQMVECAWDSGKADIRLSRLYRLSKTFSIYNFHNGNLKNIYVTGEGPDRTGIFSTAYGYAAMEILGCVKNQFRDFAIYGSGVTGETPTVAIMTGRTVHAVYAGNRTDGQSANSDNVFDSISIRGMFQWGQVYDTNGSSNRYSRMYSYAGALPNVTDIPLVLHADNHWKFGVAITGGTLLTGDPFSLPRRYSTDSGSNAGQASDNVTMVDCSFQGISGATAGARIPVDSAGFYIYGPTWVNFKNVYAASLTHTSPGADIFQLVNGAHGVFIGCPAESASRYVVSITADTSITPSRIFMEGFHGTGANTLGLYVDSNVALKDCRFDLSGLSVANGGVSLGNGAVACDFKLPQTALGFEVLAGTFTGNRVTLGTSTTNFDVSGSSNVHSNIVTDMRGTETKTVIHGNLRVGQPSYTTPNTIHLNEFTLTWAGAAPTAGSWAQGSTIWNTGAASGQPSGWICVADGTFGALTGPPTGDIANGSTQLAMSSVSGMSIGNWIGIIGVTGLRRIVNINTTTKVVTVHLANAQPSVTGGAVDFTTDPTFLAISTLP